VEAPVLSMVATLLPGVFKLAGAGTLLYLKTTP
jgi:hypothetical protein